MGDSKGRCPFMGGAARQNRDWWPQYLDISVLHQHAPMGNPRGDGFDYRRAFLAVDYMALKHDLAALMTDSQEWWPADWGHYGPLFVRMAWHSAGTYRTSDGRGGAGSGSQRFAPLNSWPDNGNLDKARRLLWPIKRKYGSGVSWSDLMILAGNVALETMGARCLGFGGGREDVWTPGSDVYWGSEREWLAPSTSDNSRYRDKRALEPSLAAVQMGLIYVNPEGPDGRPDPAGSARDIRETFKRMGMDDYDTVALIAGGHTFGKAHGAGPVGAVGPEPEAAPLHAMGLGWQNSHGTGRGRDTITSGIEGAWKPHPTRWDNGYLRVLFAYEWELTKSPAGAQQWVAKNARDEDMICDAHEAGVLHPPMMLTSDLALRHDAAYESIAREFLADHALFTDAFARAWFKLTHRDMGPRARYLGPDVPKEEFLWQDPIPAVHHALIGASEIDELKRRILGSGLSVSDLVATAWASAATFRGSDKRGGANGARIRLMPQRSWEVNEFPRLGCVLNALECVQRTFNSSASTARDMRVSLADLIVLGGCAGVEAGARAAGLSIRVPFRPGRADASEKDTDVEGFAVLEPAADGFRNYAREGVRARAELLLVDRAQQLTLSAPEMAVLVAGLRALGANHGGTRHGVFSEHPGRLLPDFFIGLLDVSVTWRAMDGDSEIFEGLGHGGSPPRWTATRADLVFGSNSQLRAIAEVYAEEGCKEKFARDFAAAWDKVMSLDRFDTL